MGFFRYPGGKSKLAKQILPKIHNGFHVGSGCRGYREPFFGGGSIGLKVAEHDLSSLWINDYDFGIYSIWYSVINRYKELKSLINSFSPSVDQFYVIKEKLSSSDTILNWKDDVLLYGFYKIVIHQLSYSGLGTKSGGPLGGKDQKSKYDISCRWSPKHMCKKIDDYNSILSSKHVKVTCCDFSELLMDTDGSLIYLDPPYYKKGNELYQFSFSQEDHVRLSKLLLNIKTPWILSYDDCPEIEDMYSGKAIVERISKVNYSINTCREKGELLISNF